MGRTPPETPPELIDRAALLAEVRTIVARLTAIVDVLEADLGHPDE